jgi:hypothetical protein
MLRMQLQTHRPLISANVVVTEGESKATLKSLMREKIGDFVNMCYNDLVERCYDLVEKFENDIEGKDYLVQYLVIV